MNKTTREKISDGLKRAYQLGERDIFNPNPKMVVPSKKDLMALHFGKQMSGRQMAEYYSVTQTQIRRWMDERGMIPRSRKEAKSGRPPIGEKNWNWKGDDVSYQALHTWVRKYKGTPKKCEHCGRVDKKKYEWANIDHSYKRNLDDWIRLCTSCHRKFDKK